MAPPRTAMTNKCEGGAGGFHDAGGFLHVLPSEAQQHHEGADPMRIGLAGDDHAEGLPRLLASQGAGASAQAGQEYTEFGFRAGWIRTTLPFDAHHLRLGPVPTVAEWPYCLGSPG